MSLNTTKQYSNKRISTVKYSFQSGVREPLEISLATAGSSYSNKSIMF